MENKFELIFTPVGLGGFRPRRARSVKSILEGVNVDVGRRRVISCELLNAGSRVGDGRTWSSAPAWDH